MLKLQTAAAAEEVVVVVLSSSGADGPSLITLDRSPLPPGWLRAALICRKERSGCTIWAVLHDELNQVGWAELTWLRPWPPRPLEGRFELRKWLLLCLLSALD